MSYLFSRKIFLILVVPLLLYGCKQKEEQQESRTPKDTTTEKRVPLLIPGKQMGSFIIDENARTLLDTFTKPDFSDAAMGKVLLKWKNVYGDSLFMFNTQKMGVENFKRIKIIRSLSPKFRTKKNLGVGSTLADLNKEYALQERGTIKEGKAVYTLFINEQGIAFEIDTSQTCHAVLIFSKQDRSINPYIPFYAHFEQAALPKTNGH